MSKKRAQIREGAKTRAKEGRAEFPATLRHLLAIGLIAGVALVAYSNTFSVPFHFDDAPNIVQNPLLHIRPLTWDRLERLITYTYKDTIRVFAMLTLAFNYYFGELDVFGYHVVNLTIHVASGAFLYWLLILTFNLPHLKERYGPISYKTALFASLIFISHPVQTQSVTYIIQRMASMGGMFYLLTMVLYVKGRQAPSRSQYLYLGSAVVAYLLGILSKENVAILPVFVVLYEFFFIQNLDLSPRGKKIVLTMLGILVVLGAIGIAVWGRRYMQVITEGFAYRDRLAGTSRFTLSERVLTQLRVVLYYLTLVIYPHPSRLNLDYDFSVSKGMLSPPTTLVSLLIIAGVIGYSVWTAKKRPMISFWILWYFGNLVIESSIFPLEMVYEHRLYLPAVGPFVLFSLGILRVIERFGGRAAVAPAGPPPAGGTVRG
jgi:protein O-mannosyl-transferase